MKRLYSLSFGLALLTSPLWAQQPPQSYALTESEAAEVKAAREAVEAAKAALNQVGGIVLGADVTDSQQTGAAVCVVQIRQLRLQLAEARQEALTWRLRARVGCPECQVEGGRLVRGKP